MQKRARPRRVRRALLLALALLLPLLLPIALSGPAQAADDAGRIDARWLALGADAGPLGAAASEPYDVGADGRARDFAGGRIFWSPGTDAWEVMAPVADLYLALGGPAGVLGFPTAPATALPTAPGGLEQPFAGGRVYVSPESGAHAVSGAILIRFLELGGTVSYLGFPTGDTAATDGGFTTTFQRGRIDWGAAGGALTVTGTWAPVVRRVTAGQIPYSYRSGCPVPPAGLRRIVMPYYDWDGVPRFGALIARSTVVDDLQRVFRAAFDARFPIRKMNPVDVYRGSDIAAMAADNTSAFNCRKVTGNPYRLSQHSWGNAIDINTVENPYVTPARVYPTSGRSFLDRAEVRTGMIMRRGPIATAMARQGWLWGARWAHPDYQHFSSNGG